MWSRRHLGPGSHVRARPITKQADAKQEVADAQGAPRQNGWRVRTARGPKSNWAAFRADLLGWLGNKSARLNLLRAIFAKLARARLGQTRFSCAGQPPAGLNELGPEPSEGRRRAYLGGAFCRRVRTSRQVVVAVAAMVVGRAGWQSADAN